jgi:hypothetical protein
MIPISGLVHVLLLVECLISVVGMPVSSGYVPLLSGPWNLTQLPTALHASGGHLLHLSWHASLLQAFSSEMGNLTSLCQATKWRGQEQQPLVHGGRKAEQGRKHAEATSRSRERK